MLHKSGNRSPREAARRQSRAHSTLILDNISVAGRRTSLRLEADMWRALGEVSERERRSTAEIVTEIARTRSTSTLTSAVRVYLIRYFYVAGTEEGHRLAGHGAAPARVSSRH